MILSDKYKFIFMHNPKCGGTSVRAVLRPFHDGDPLFISRGRKPHPVLGDVIYTHLTLRNLKNHYTSEFSKLNEYESYALMRDPKLRFVSGLSQFLREMKGVDTKIFSLRQYIDACEEVCTYLQNQEEIKNHRYIHFQRQLSYIFLDGEQVVRHVWGIDQIDDLLSDLQARSGCDLSAAQNTKHNASISYRSRSAEVAHTRIQNFASFLPGYAKPQWLRKVLHAAFLYTPSASKIWQGIPEKRRHMILDYYSADLEYYDSMQRGSSAQIVHKKIS